VTSRREEKERRRAERLASEEQAARSEARRRRIGVAVGAALGIAAVGAIVIAVTAGGGRGGDKEGPTKTFPKVPIPPQKTTDVRAAASAAGCQLRSFRPGPNDQLHVKGPVRYEQDPPVFGPHHEIPAHDGNYAGQGTPLTEPLVHALEHGRVIIWYRPGTADRAVGQLETLFSEPFAGQPAGYKQILVERPSMPFAVAATSWGQQLGCPRFSERVFDALRAFRASYVSKAPEGNVPFPE
jgi:hypothetical protein